MIAAWGEGGASNLLYPLRVDLVRRKFVIYLIRSLGFDMHALSVFGGSFTLGGPFLMREDDVPIGNVVSLSDWRKIAIRFEILVKSRWGYIGWAAAG